MKKVFLGLGSALMMGLPTIAVVSCGNSASSQKNDAQKDVDTVLKFFQDAHLVVNTTNAVKANSGDFNAEVLQDLGGYSGVYPGISLPEGIKMTYHLNAIPVGKTDNLVVTIAKNGAQSKNFNILVDVTKVKLVNVNSKPLATANMQYSPTKKTLTIGDNVGEINFDLSSIWDIKKINWGNKPQNILKIGDYAFSQANLQTLNLVNLTNLTTIGEETFAHAPITTLDLSGLTNLTTIGDYAFASSKITGLLDLSVLTNLDTIGIGAFYASKLTNLNLAGLTKLTTIGEDSFLNAPITTLNLSGLTSLTTIGDYTFDNAQLTSLNLSGLTNLATIGNGAFYASKLTTLDLSGLTNLTTIGGGAFNSVESQLQLKMGKTKYNQLIYDKVKAIDNREDIFGTNGGTINRINP